MIQKAGKLGIVQLVFDKTPEKSALYAHSPYLIASSGVLRGILEDQEDQYPPAKVARLNSSAETADASTTTIPLDDEDTAAWECVLAMLYPQTALQTKISWDNIEKLAMLADKYDMPTVLDRVDAFLDEPMDSPDVHKRTRLRQTLTDDSVLLWLQVFSRCGMDSHIWVCVQYIVRHDLQLPKGYLGSGIQHQHSELLFKALQDSYANKLCCKSAEVYRNSAEILSLQRWLKEAEGDLETERAKKKPTQCGRFVCRMCESPWYWLMSGSKESPTCMQCGVTKLIGFTNQPTWYQS